MTLRRKMGLQIMTMIVGLLVVGATALWGINALHVDYGLAAEGNQELRGVFEVGSHLKTALILLSLQRVDRARAHQEVDLAAVQFDQLSRRGAQQPGAPRVASDAAAEAAVRQQLDRAARQLATPPELQGGGDVLEADRDAIGSAIAGISTLTSGIGKSIQAHQLSAKHERDVTVRAVSAVSAAVVIGAIVVGIMQYRGVMDPLGNLRIGVRRIAAGQFAQRVDPRGGEEFVELAGEFNRMATELDGFYLQLEQKVEQKSKELIRSERLASLGYLAAGVAHEINNPLGIISGYAEYSLDQLQRGADGDPDLARSLRIICEEAFRCKDITAKLLSLARQGDESRHPVCLADVADKVESIVGGLREFRDRRLVVEAPDDPEARRQLCVLAVEAEMQQVILNLTLNALEASPPGSGRVTLSLAQDGQTVQLTVTDNGRGMTKETVERAFEPFFTEKRGSADTRGARSHGTGLGLSITHAIVQAHGGAITAQSDGPGSGSRFVAVFGKPPSKVLSAE